MSATQLVKSQFTTFLDQPPSCLEFCPLAPNYLVIGTYLLTQIGTEDSTSPEQTKTGSIQLFKLDSKDPALSHIQTISLPHAVFDLHFSPRDPTIFAIATSAASVSLYRVEQPPHESSSSHPQITHLQTIIVRDDTAMPVLYLAWLPPSPMTSQQGTVSKADGFAVSFSDGLISIFHNKNNDKPIYAFTGDSLSEDNLSTQDMIEVWYLAFHHSTVRQSDNFQSSPLLLFFGDDFGALGVHEFLGDECDGDDDDGDGDDQNLTGGEGFPMVSSTSTDRGKHHGAGVTSILPLFSNEAGTFLLTGSYDEYIRVIHRGFRWKVLTEKGLGGGVWRLKLLNDGNESGEGRRSYLVLASCMHGGARIVRISYSVSSDCPEDILAATWDIQILYEFTEHESMNYASDVFKGGSDGDSGGLQVEEAEKQGVEGGTDLLCVSSSFYDKRVCLWSAKCY